MSGFLGQLGTVDESTYGTPVTVTKFHEFMSESLVLETGRVESPGIRASMRALRSDRRVPFIMGASGSIEMDVLSKGFGFWLKHMLGSVATTGPAETSVYTHTGTVGDLTGDFFTTQVGVPQIGGGTITPKTVAGCKIKSWELSCKAGEALKFKAEIDGQTLEHTTALATASYPTTVEPLTFIGGVCTIGGTSTDITDFTVKCDNGLKTDRRYLRTSALKKEPVESGLRQVSATLGLDFDNLTNQNRFIAATAAGTQAAVVLYAQGLTTIGSTLKNRVTITLPAFMFDGDTPTVAGPDVVPQQLSGVALYDVAGSAQAISVAYQTLDTTP
jgi:hypothetical protein